MDSSYVLFWQLTWFFSFDDTTQAALIGPTEEQWFIEEDDENSGANYLIGLCHAFDECSSARPDNSYAVEFYRALLAVSGHFQPSYWCFRTLSATAEWNRLRALASTLLQLENPRVTPPRKPFRIEDLIHVDHYQHASKVRLQLSKHRKHAR